MTTVLELSTTVASNGIPVVAAAGEIDRTNADGFAAAVAAAAATGRAVVDLTAVGYLDSAGLVPLFTHAEQIELVISTLLRPVISVSGLDTVTAVRVRAAGQS